MSNPGEQPKGDELRYLWSIKGQEIDADPLDKFQGIENLSADDGKLLLSDLRLFSDALAQMMLGESSAGDTSEKTEMSEESLKAIIGLYNQIADLYNQLAPKVQGLSEDKQMLMKKIESSHLIGAIKKAVRVVYLSQPHHAENGEMD